MSHKSIQSCGDAIQICVINDECDNMQNNSGLTLRFSDGTFTLDFFSKTGRLVFVCSNVGGFRRRFEWLGGICFSLSFTQGRGQNFSFDLRRNRSGFSTRLLGLNPPRPFFYLTKKEGFQS